MQITTCALIGGGLHQVSFRGRRWTAFILLRDFIYFIGLIYCASVVCVILIDFQVSGMTVLLERIHSFLTGSRTLAAPGSTLMSAKTCGDPDCDIGPNATVSLGYTKWETWTWWKRPFTSAEVHNLFLLSSALLKIRRSVHTENPAFWWLVEQTFVSCEAPVHLVQPRAQPVHQCDHACWAEAHWSPATFC